MSHRTILNATSEGLKQRLAKIERDIADLHREQSWQYDPPEAAATTGGGGDLPSFTATGATGLSGTHLDGGVNFTVASYFGDSLSFPSVAQHVAEVSSFNGKTIDVLLGGMYLMTVQGYWLTPTTDCGLWIDGPLVPYAASAPAYTINGATRSGASISALVPLYNGASIDVYALGGDCASGDMKVQIDLTLVRATSQWD